jgi:hypothetical protein
MKEEIKIRLGNDSQEPMVVYVSGWHPGFEYWICEKINSGDTVLSKESQLIDFDYKEFQRLYYEWKIQQQDVIKERFIKLLEELVSN